MAKLPDIKDMTTDDIRAKMRSGEIIPPKDLEERKKFIRFISQEPGSEVRNSMLQELEPEGPKSNDPPPEKEPESLEKPGEKPPEKPPERPPEQKPSKQWWEELGYADEGQAGEKHKELLSDVSKKQEMIDRFNAERGTVGREKAELKKQLREAQEKLSEFEKSNAPQKPQRPKRPSPDDFEDGQMDDKYLEAINKYEESMVTYEEQLDAYFESKLEGKPEPKPREEVPSENPWNEVFNDDIPQLQEKFGLKTTIPFSQINANKWIVENPRNYSPDQVAEAKSFLEKVPPSDTEKFQKIVKAVSAKYDVVDSTPIKRYNTWEAAFLDKGMTAEFNHVTPDDLTPEEEKGIRDQQRETESNTARHTPAHKMGGNDRLPSESATHEDEVSEFRDLNDKYRTATLQKRGDLWLQSDEGKRFIALREKVKERLMATRRRR